MLIKKFLILLVYLGIIPAGIALITLFGAGGGSDLGVKLFAILILLPWPIAFFFLKKIEGKDKKLFISGTDDISGAQYHFFSQGWGVAINPLTRKILLKDDRSMKIYHFEDIRSWATSHHSGGYIIAGGIAVAAANTAQIISNSKNTCLRVEVRDVDHAKWMISMDKNNQERWSEILRQAINEGNRG